MEIEKRNGEIHIFTPYNPEFVERLKKAVSAKWTGQCWQCKDEHIDIVREIMVDVYGYNDIVSADLVTVKLSITEEIREARNSVVIFGKVVASAYGRDSGARIGDDVAFVKGGATSGGSVKNWYTIIEKGSEIVLSNVSKSLLKDIPSCQYSIVERQNVDKKALLEEKEKLLKRIAEIEKILEIS